MFLRHYTVDTMMSNDVVNIISYSTTYCLKMFALLFHDEYEFFYTFGYLTFYCLLTFIPM